MTVSLTKGGNVNLTKDTPGLTKVILGLGWDPRTTDGAAYDLDASALGVTAAGKVKHDDYFVFFGHLATADQSIVHSGDNLTGGGEGDDEQITIDLPKIPDDITKVVAAVTIYEAAERSQNFGNVRNAFIRVVDASTGTELARYDLQEDFSTQTAVIFGELYRNGADWKFRAVGEGYAAGLKGIASDFGVNV